MKFILSAYQPADVLGANQTRGWRWQRYHLWAKQWKNSAAEMARKHHLAGIGPAKVAVAFEVNRSVRRDPHNYMSTVCKHIIDGLVVAGVWPDDNPRWLTLREPRFIPVGLRTGYRYYVYIKEKE